MQSCWLVCLSQSACSKQPSVGRSISVGLAEAMEVSMNRYYVEFATVYEIGKYIYVYAYNEQHVRDIFNDYELVAIDQTD